MIGIKMVKIKDTINNMLKSYSEHLELTDKDREDLIKALIKSFENYEKALIEINKKIIKLELELR